MTFDEEKIFHTFVEFLVSIIERDDDGDAGPAFAPTKLEAQNLFNAITELKQSTWDEKPR